MPRPADRLPDNAPGDWYVDRSCIDCGTCRRLAPATFAEAEGHARVHTQPRDTATTLRAVMAQIKADKGKQMKAFERKLQQQGGALSLV